MRAKHAARGRWHTPLEAGDGLMQALEAQGWQVAGLEEHLGRVRKAAEAEEDARDASRATTCTLQSGRASEGGSCSNTSAGSRAGSQQQRHMHSGSSDGVVLASLTLRPAVYTSSRRGCKGLNVAPWSGITCGEPTWGLQPLGALSWALNSRVAAGGAAPS
jgi:hypothetical protein